MISIWPIRKDFQFIVGKRKSAQSLVNLPVTNWFLKYVNVVNHYSFHLTVQSQKTREQSPWLLTKQCVHVAAQGTGGCPVLSLSLQLIGGILWRVGAVPPAIALSNCITLKRHSSGRARKKAKLAFKRLIRMGKNN